MQLNLPDDLEITEEQARLDLAVGLYSSHTLSLARAAHLGGKSLLDFQRLLAERGIPLAYGLEDIDHDLDTLKRLGQI